MAGWIAALIFDVAVAFAVARDANGRDWSGRVVGARGWTYLSLLLSPLAALVYLARRPRREHTQAGWYKDPEGEAPYRYWNGERWTERMRDRRPISGGTIAAFVVIGLVILGLIWSTGAFDKQLASAGLNAHDCVQNGFGATFCGDDADRYKEQVERLQRQFDAP